MWEGRHSLGQRGPCRAAGGERRAGANLPAQIKVDVKEVEGGYTVNAEIPGVNKDDIHVGIDGNVITLRAEVKQEDKKTEGEKVLRSERYYGAVSRSFQLPAEIDPSADRKSVV